MSENKFNLKAYLRRISYKGEVTPTTDTLIALHHAQLYTIPFENFDIQLGREINLHPDIIFKKLIKKNRGGYCFELNGLFLRALKSIGFDVRALLARVHISGTPSGRSHQLELVTIEGKEWIADVGFGAETPRAPIPLILNQPTIHDGQEIRLVDADHFGIMLQTKKNNEWIDLYSFDLSHIIPADIDQANHFTSTHPSSFFVLARVATLPVKNGVITLFNNTFKETIAGDESVQYFACGKPYLNSLKKYFGIELDEAYEKLRPVLEKESVPT